MPRRRKSRNARAFLIGAALTTVVGAAASPTMAAGVLPTALGQGSSPTARPPGSGEAPAVESAPTSLVGATPTLPADVIAASAAPGSTWKPEPAIYGTKSINDVAVPGYEGTTVRVDVIYPTTTSGAAAKGPFPVVLTMTPYGKGQGGSSSAGSASQPSSGSVTGGADNYLVQRGYIDVVMDVRGTGDTDSRWGLFDPVQTQDAIKVVDWAARLPHANGKVGTYGPSYLGIDQLLLAGSIGRGSPLKAIFPDVAANDVYRDTSFMGGLIDTEFDLTYLALTAGLNTVNPIGDAASDPAILAELAQIETDHLTALGTYDVASLANILSGGSEAYDGSYWQQRAPQNLLANIVANGIPAYLVGGEFDIFQNGEPLNFAGLQNAWDGRSTTAPMVPGQPTTGRYQLIDGPWEHINGSAVDLDPLELEWFDTWLKGEHTGMATTPTPLHYYDLGTGAFDETTTYPFTGVQPTKLYFGSGGTLRTAAPAPRSAGSDRIVWSPSGIPCGRPIDQWSMGIDSIASHSAHLPAACADDDRLTQLGPWETTYTTAPLRRAETVAGPITATVYASATTAQTEWVAQVEEVTPSGQSYPLTEGALLGSLRAVDPSRSWSAGGDVIYPFHPYTVGSSRAVTPGAVTQYQIQIFPTLDTIAKGDRLRVTIATADAPHLTPQPAQLLELAGGVYRIERTPAAPSSLTVELRPA